jgi:hypothetical protein
MADQPILLEFANDDGRGGVHGPGGTLLSSAFILLPISHSLPIGFVASTSVSWSNIIDAISAVTKMELANFDWLDHPIIQSWYAAVQSNPEVYVIKISCSFSDFKEHIQHRFTDEEETHHLVSHLLWKLFHHAFCDWWVAEAKSRMVAKILRYMKAALFSANLPAAGKTLPALGYTSHFFSVRFALYYRPPDVRDWKRQFGLAAYSSALQSSFPLYAQGLVVSKLSINSANTAAAVSAVPIKAPPRVIAQSPQHSLSSGNSEDNRGSEDESPNMTQHLANLLGQFKTTKQMTPPAMKRPPSKKQKIGNSNSSTAGGSDSGVKNDNRRLFQNDNPIDEAAQANLVIVPTAIFNPRVSASQTNLAVAGRTTSPWLLPEEQETQSTLPPADPASPHPSLKIMMDAFSQNAKEAEAQRKLINYVCSCITSHFLALPQRSPQLLGGLLCG